MVLVMYILKNAKCTAIYVAFLGMVFLVTFVRAGEWVVGFDCKCLVNGSVG